MKKEETQPQHLMYTVSSLHEGPTREYGACATANLVVLQLALVCHNH